MLRSIAVLAMFAFCSLTGIRASFNLKLRLDTLQAMQKSLREISMGITYAKEPLEKLIRRCGNERTAVLFHALEKGMAVETNMQAAWRKAIEYAQANDQGFAALQEDEIKLMESYAATLGNSTYACEIKQAALLQKQLDKISKEAEGEYKQKGRMYQSMGILCGVAIAIVML